jgi:hypothetical protein
VIKDRALLNFIEKFLHLSFSAEKEVMDFFEELYKIKGITFEKFIEGKDFQFKGNKKQDTAKFLKIIRDYRYPVMNKTMNKVKNLSNQVKTKGIKVEYPENLEGDTLLLNLEIKNEKDVEKLIKHLEKKKNELELLIRTIKSGQ